MLWTEKYRPANIEDYVFVDETQMETVVDWIVKKEIPHLMLSGAPGVGKTTLAKILFNELDVPEGDVLEINASARRGIDTIRDDITRFAQTMPRGDYKYILLDEADMLTVQAQMPLKFIMERYAEFTRFILTCNRPERIDEAIKSRCVHFHIKKTNRDQFYARAETVLKTENITFTKEILESHVDQTYPDLRSCIKNLQTNSVNGVLRDAAESIADEDYVLDSIALFRQGKYEAGRKILTANTQGDGFVRLYRLLYENLEWWTTDAEKQKALILAIAQGVRWHGTCADQEINFSAVLIRMEQLK